MNAKPRALQRMWAKSVLSGYSFAAIAPTGIGKTSFGIIMALYLSSKGKRSYLILPTTLLLKECVEKLDMMGGCSVLSRKNEKRRKRGDEGENFKGKL